MKAIYFAMTACLLGMAPATMLAQNEHPDRGLVVAKGQADGHYFASWRLLESDGSDASFTLLKDGKPYMEGIAGATSVEVDGTPTTKWQVVTEASSNADADSLSLIHI